VIRDQAGNAVPEGVSFATGQMGLPQANFRIVDDPDAIGKRKP
jgi:hypothetical protein